MLITGTREFLSGGFHKLDSSSPDLLGTASRVSYINSNSLVDSSTLTSAVGMTTVLTKCCLVSGSMESKVSYVSSRISIKK